MNAPGQHPKHPSRTSGCREALERQAEAGAAKCPPRPRPERAKRAEGYDIIWTNHAAKRMVRRRFDPDKVMEAIAHLCASGLLCSSPTPFIRNRLKVVAKELDPVRGVRRILIITVTHDRPGNTRPRNMRTKRRRNR